MSFIRIFDQEQSSMLNKVEMVTPGDLKVSYQSSPEKVYDFSTTLSEEQLTTLDSAESVGKQFIAWQREGAITEAQAWVWQFRKWHIRRGNPPSRCIVNGYRTPLTMLRDHFLTEAQIEELDTYGKIDLDDATMDALFDWLRESEELDQSAS